MMRNGLLCVALLAALVACKGGVKKEAAPVTSAPSAPSGALAVASNDAPKGTAFDQQTKWLRAHAEAFNKHDADAIMAGYVANDATATKWGELKSHFTDYPDTKMTITRSWHIKDVVLVEFVQGGTSDAGKKPYGYVGATLFWFNPEGQVTEDATYSDELTMEVQLGTAERAASKIDVRPLRSVPPFSATWEQHRARETPEETKLLGVRDHLYSKLTASSQKDFLDLMTDDIELVAYDEPKDAKGKKAIAELFGGRKVMFSDIKVEAEHSWACEDYAIFEGTFSGRHTGPWGPIAATKKDFSNHFVDVTRITKDGKVDRIWTYANNAELIEQLTGQ